MNEQLSEQQVHEDTRKESDVKTTSRDTEDSDKLNTQMLVEGLTVLGTKFARLTQAAWSSADRKAIEARLKERLSADPNRIWSTLEQNSATLEAASNTVFDVSLVNYTAKTMLALMRSVGEQVDSLAVRLESGEPLIVGDAQSKADLSQGIPIDDPDSEHEQQFRDTQEIHSDAQNTATD